MYTEEVSLICFTNNFEVSIEVGVIRGFAKLPVSVDEPDNVQTIHLAVVAHP